MNKPDFKEYSPDGYEVVYISEYFFSTLEKEMDKISRTFGERAHTQ